MITFGLDISHYQSVSLDLKVARRDGCEFVFIKATEGGSIVDSAFAANLAEARAAGQLVAAYVFVRSNATPAQHVALAVQVIPTGVPIILDVETAADGTKPTLAHARSVLDAFRAAGRVPVLSYIPLWYWRDVWGSPSLAGWPPLWSSRYPDTLVGLLADEWAAVPEKYWNGYGGLPVAVLQFTSSASIAGYAPLDANAFRGSRADLAALFYGNPAPAPKELDQMFTNESVPAGANRRWHSPVESGDNSSLIDKMWLSASCGWAGKGMTYQVFIAAGRDAAGEQVYVQPVAGWPVKGTIGNDDRAWWELPQGADSVSVAYSCPDDSAPSIAISYKPKG